MDSEKKDAQKMMKSCFGIMPLKTNEFNDVWHTIQECVKKVDRLDEYKCKRLDIAHPAGKITVQLEKALRAASLCIADVTGKNANVMFELGYAVAIGCPTILVCQDTDDQPFNLPFDIYDLRTVKYERMDLAATLTDQLTDIIRKTLEEQNTSKPDNDTQVQLDDLETQNSAFKGIIAQFVYSFDFSNAEYRGQRPSERELKSLQGEWIEKKSGRHLYVKLIKQDLVALCSDGVNSSGVSAHFEWQRCGSHWFARCVSLDNSSKGYTFFEQVGPHELLGAWWNGDEKDAKSLALEFSGIPARWIRRQPEELFKEWAIDLLDKAESRGMGELLAPK
jgi:nucleoside 2-deoxyribosyltransferase